MRRMDLYLGKTLLATILLAWLVVVSLDTGFSFLGEIGDIGRGEYDLGDAVLFVLLTLPGRAYQSFPMAAVIGALLGLGNLAAQSELNVFRLAGCSPARLTASVLQVGVLMLFAVVAMGEGWAPATQQLARQMRASAIFDEVTVQRDSGFWLRDGQHLIRVRQSEVDGTLSDVLVFRVDATPKLASVSAVSRARYQQGGWQLEGVRESRFTDQGVEARFSEQTQWPALMDPGLAQLLTRDPQTLSLFELGKYISYLQRSGTDAAVYQLVYWQRWTAPLAAMAMLFLSVSLVLGPLGQRSVGQRILVGVLVGLVFKLLNEITAHAGLVYGIASWFGAVLPTFVVFVLGMLMLRRAG